MLRRLIAEDITLITSLDVALGPLMADPTQIHQVIMNLVVNARDAMPSGGTLTLETRNHAVDETAAATQPDARAGEYVVFSVTDSGTGMDDATREHLFEPFFTTKGSEHGSGLGLSTVYGIVRQSGGWIDVRTRLGAGSTFELFFPRIDGGQYSQHRQHKDRLQARADETVLVVEDQDAVRGLIAAVLKDHGYRVLEAANAEGALAIAREYPVELHLLLTDVVLPGMNGRELADELRLLRPGIKVLFTSGYTADVIAHRGVVDFGLAYLPKPFTERALALKVREVLDNL
jgi:CheY-like chemotaxis protein